MMDKTEIIERLRFVKDIFDKVDDPGFTRDELCGVFFYKGNAYCTNNHVICRIKDKKGVYVDDLLFWSYSQDITSIHVSKDIFRTNFVKHLDSIFDSYAENYFFIKRKLLLESIPHELRTDSAKTKTSVCIKLEENLLKLFFINKKRKVVSTTSIPILTFRGKNLRIVEGATFTVNLLYLFKVTSLSLNECDIIGFKLKNNCTHPIIIFNKSSNRPDISWSIAQIVLKIK